MSSRCKQKVIQCSIRCAADIFVIYCLGPRYCKPSRTDTRKRRVLAFTFRSFDDVLPERYPRARCPTENMESFIAEESCWCGRSLLRYLCQLVSAYIPYP